MRRLIWGFVAAAVLLPFAAGSKVESGPRERVAGESTGAPLDLSRAVCPVLGEAVSAEHFETLGRARVYFSSAEALAEYQRHPTEYLALSRAQLLATGQLRQQACALTGAPLRGYYWVTVAGAEVRVANASLQAAARRRPQPELTTDVFTGPGFTANFAMTPVAVAPQPVVSSRDLVEFSEQIPETAETAAAMQSVLEKLSGAMAAVTRNSSRLRPREGWIGLGASLSSTGRPMLVAVLSKAEASKLLPATLDGFPVEGVVAGEFYAGGTEASAPETPGPNAPVRSQAAGGTVAKFNTSRVARLERPVPIGVSTGADYTKAVCTSGTIGCRLVRLDAAGNPVYYALGNNHIFGGLNQAPLESEILQPGLADSSCVGPETNLIGRLSRRQLIQFGGLPNRIDAALALVTPETMGNSTPTTGYGTPRSQHIAPVVGLLTRKFGRTTGQTTGRISLINASIYVNYGSGSVYFTGQTLVSVRSPSTIMGRGGDSGSLMVTDSNNSPVGLLFAVNSSGSAAICNDLREVFTAFADLNLRVDGVN